MKSNYLILILSHQNDISFEDNACMHNEVLKD